MKKRVYSANFSFLACSAQVADKRRELADERNPVHCGKPMETDCRVGIEGSRRSPERSEGSSLRP